MSPTISNITSTSTFATDTEQQPKETVSVPVSVPGQSTTTTIETITTTTEPAQVAAVAEEDAKDVKEAKEGDKATQLMEHA